MKNIIEYFIKYPVAVNVLMIAIVLGGWQGLKRMNSSFFPLIPPDTITITAIYPGASPQEVEEGVILKIEDNLRGLQGIERFTSVSSENTGTVSVEIEEDQDINVVLAEIKNAVDRVPSFPVDLEPLVVAKQERLNLTVSMGLSGPNINLKTLKAISRRVEDDLRDMGASQIQISGYPDEEIEIAVREKDLRAFDLTFNEVAAAVGQANILTTGGSIKTDTEEYLIRANNRSYYGDEMDYIVVKSDPSGRTIRLRDVADVNDKWSENPDRIYVNGEPAVEISVFTTNSEDFLGMVDKVKEYILGFNEENSTVQLDILADRSISLVDRTRILLENGGYGIIMVLILLSIFLKPSLAFWVAVGIPISFFGMFIIVPDILTINVMSLFGMLIVIGILVDDAIVIGENIYAHYERGKTPVRASIDGTMEVLPAIVSAILTTVVAFSTFLFVQGGIGDFYYEVAVVVIVTLLFSLIEALIILPAHISESRAMKEGKKPFILNRYADKFMVWIRETLYIPMLRFGLNNPVFGVSIPIGMLLITVGCVQGGIIRTTFFPNITSDRISISMSMPEGTNEVITDSLITLIEDGAWRANEKLTKEQTGNTQIIESSVKRIGPGSSNATLTLNLLTGEERDFASGFIAQKVEEEVGELNGVESLTYGSGGNFGGLPVSVALTGRNIEELKGAKEELKRELRQLGTLKDINDNDPQGIKEIKIDLKENAYLLGLTLNTVMAQVRSAFFGQSVQRIQRGRDEIRVWVRYDRDERESVKNLDDMWIVTNDRSRVPLSEIANYSVERGEVDINHLDGIRQITVSADLKDQGQSATDILANVRQEIMPRVLAQYPSVQPLYEGQNREANKVISSMVGLLPAVFMVMYMIIAFGFRSYSQPMLLFALIPFSLVGVAWGHWLHGAPISILSTLGIIALIGILVNDGLVLVGKFNTHLKEGLNFHKALVEAGRSRFRAIFLTSITTAAGLAPIIFEPSRTAQFLIPMAISIAYGIIMATFLTLFVLPLFIYFNNTRKLVWYWLRTGTWADRASLERAVMEVVHEREASAHLKTTEVVIND
jgi:multidrug efflux pump subunit AcrB